ncbi:hypothetical protein PP178_04090 [Zeaxanthinibacter sp. PT1]|uniref:hypothetical protein n=1 Tax=Zeaxanthinibacter TaxID=561554 RepID=UPI00234975D1|nr:hypothetical protein [Zeaxanthinibacter sp. PT1]MDC6350721.1 hypothetical protein [Zeaxanthinibacter sp. PT1]
MKRFLSILMIAAICYACSKDLGTSTEQGQAVRFTAVQSEGTNGGSTTFGSSTTGRADSTLFISQYPLKEYRYIQEVTYDSVPTYTIDQNTGDTTSTRYDVYEVSRDTVDLVIGNLWAPYEEKNTSDILVGIPHEMVSDTMYVSIRVRDSLPSEEYGLVVTGLMDEDGYIYESSTDNGDFRVLPEYKNLTQVPIYDDMGKVASYSPGIDMTNFLYRQYQIAPDRQLIRSFTMTITNQDKSVSISADFDINFVEYQLWEGRQCWLAGEKECEDLYQN